MSRLTLHLLTKLSQTLNANEYFDSRKRRLPITKHPMIFLEESLYCYSEYIKHNNINYNNSIGYFKIVF